MASTMWQTSRRFVALAVAATTLACGDGGSDPEPGLLNEVVTALAAEGVAATATFHTGEAPTAGGGPAVTATVQSAAVVGGSALVTLSSATPFQRVLLAAGSQARGWWELTLPAPTTSVDVIVTLDPDVDLASLATELAVATSGGAVGAYEDAPITVIQVGTGDVQVSISWDSPTDVDLHVVEPGGEEVYYGNDVSATGGTLDLDSNAGCTLDNKKNENITWATGSAPRGTYTVRVDYWDACSFTGTTNYVVTVRRSGAAPQTFTGTLTGPGDNGGAGDGVTITSFTW